MPTRYFKATDGKLTYFRASPTRAYCSLTAPRDSWVENSALVEG